MKGDSLGDRMKTYYEGISRQFLYRKIPVIMRLDGKAFHTFTKGCKKPFDDKIIETMQFTTETLMRKIQGAKIAYVQSDEISILISDYDALETCGWYDYNVQKMTSVSAAIASVTFTLNYPDIETHLCDVDHAYFDSRVFNIPKEDVVNYFRWRYQDWVRNSRAMLAQSMFSQSELQGKNTVQQVQMCRAKGTDWENLEDVYKNGTLFYWAEVDGSKRLMETCSVNLNSNDECEGIFEDYV